MRNRTSRTASLLLVSVVGLIGARPSLAQEVLKLDRDLVCGAEPTDIPSEVYLFDPTGDAEKVIRALVDYLGLSGSKIQLRASNVESALAYVDPVTQGRLILYNEAFVRKLKREAGSAWVQRAILAHELGHHLENHLQDLRPGRRAIEELEADRFAGHLLFKMDANLEVVTRVFEQLKEGQGYPPRSARVAAATNGWYTAQEQSEYRPDKGAQLPSGTVSASNPVPAPEPAPENRVRLLAEQAPMVPHSAGLVGGPGLTFRLEGTVSVMRPGPLGVVVQFSFDDGSVLFPHPQELKYRDVAGRVATGTTFINVGAGEVDLSTIGVDPIPYYALNLVPTAFNTLYRVQATAQVVFENQVIATSPPVGIVVQW